MKSFDELRPDLSHYTVAQKEEYEYAHYVKETAALLGRKYIVVHRMFERDNWSLQLIKELYYTSTKHSGNMPPAVYWWWQRKKINESRK